MLRNGNTLAESDCFVGGAHTVRARARRAVQSDSKSGFAVNTQVIAE